MTSSPTNFSDYEVLPAPGFNSYFGTLLRKTNGKVGDPDQFCIVPEPKHLNGGGALHGGFLMTVADNVLGAGAHFSLPEGAMAATLTLNTDFLAGGKAGIPLYGRAQITRQTKSLVFMSGDLTQDGRVLMSASGIWKILGA